MTKLPDNVIQFPKQLTAEEKQERFNDVLIDIALDISLGVFNKLDIVAEALYFGDFDDTTKKDLLLIHEAVKSCLYRQSNKDHYLQDVADKIAPELIEELEFRYDDLDE